MAETGRCLQTIDATDHKKVTIIEINEIKHIRLLDVEFRDQVDPNRVRDCILGQPQQQPGNFRMIMNNNLSD